MMDYILTQKNASRIGIPAGTKVQVELRSDREKPPSQKNIRIAKNVYLQGRRIAGILELDEC